ncbi:LppX_LprAFG lipoprotein [Streptomyces melanogenes]|uniref:LppX_LprAFG lipoprotein n=1 Tax=Streptomyces melanogenes TaxID=67326 RepID=UPI00167D7505|nr:LppX_LprAFG lipoprotein [Streptomyces melanogenes]
MLVAASAAVLLCAGCSTSTKSHSPTPADTPRPSAASSSPGDAGALVRAAVAATRATTARIDEKIEVGDERGSFPLTVTGDFDMAADRGRLAVDFPGGAISHLDEVFAGDTVYLRNNKNTPHGWNMLERAAAQSHYLLRAPVNDPEHVLAQIALMRRVTHSGQDTINGTRCVRYRGVLDHAAITLRLSATVREQADAARSELGTDLPVHAEAWTDPHGRLVRARLSFNAGTAHLTTTLSLSDLGKPVTITPPAATDAQPVTVTGGVLPG